ncbi:MAG: septum formation initiator family protein [Synergistaceae bacterium]|nr:septum formation initiator family protein [Synergistaceae bacterium]
MPSLKRILIGAFILLVLSIAATYYLFEVRRILQIQEAIGEREAVLNEKRESLRSYREKVAFYKTKEGIEHLAREQYNLVEPGERVFLLRSPDVFDAGTPR